MILINLLPHREAARKRQRELFFVQLGVAAVAGLLISGGIYGWYDAQIGAQQQRNGILQAENKKLDAQIKEIVSLQAELDALKARQTAVEDLQSDRNLPVYLLEEMVKQLPEGVYLRSLKQENQSVLLAGTALSQEKVSELLRNLANNSPVLEKPQLIEIVAGRGGARAVSNFSVRVALIRPKPPGAESAAPQVTAKKT